MRNRASTKVIAARAMKVLFRLAKEHNENSELGRRYVELARRYGMRAKVRIPWEYRLILCRKCNRLMIPGVTSRVRLQPRREPHVSVTCLKCGNIRRFVLR